MRCQEYEYFEPIARQCAFAECENSTQPPPKVRFRWTIMSEIDMELGILRMTNKQHFQLLMHILRIICHSTELDQAKSYLTGAAWGS